MKYNPTENTAIRFSAGRAFRIANVFVENASFLASTRKIVTHSGSGAKKTDVRK